MNQELLNTLEKGYARQQQGDLATAEKAYLKVLRRDPGNEFALNLMGVVCVRAERFDEAVDYLTRALQVNSGDPETHNNLGLAYKGLNQFDRSRDAFLESIRLNEEQPVTLNNLGNVLAAVDEHDKAIPCFEAALALDSNYVDCLNNLSVSLKEVGRLEHAIETLDYAISIDDKRSLTFNNKGDVLLKASQYEAAREAFERAIDLDGNIVAKINLSTALKQLGDEQGAVTVLNGVLAVEENNAEAHNHLGVVLEQMGDTEEAAREFRLALKYTPNHASSFFQLSKLKDHALTAQEIDKIHALLKDPQLLDIHRAPLLFALAWDYEYQKNYHVSIDYFILAQAVKARRQPYVESETTAYVDACRETFPVSPASVEGDRDKLPVPVFVVGMPRSGTSLTEQIIASHSEITGAGEVGFINDLVKRASELTEQPYPISMQHLSEDEKRQLRKTYLTRMVTRFGHSRFVVDKNPLNFNFIGVIAAVFPEARVLFCKRDPMDNCVSIFRLPFDDNQKYAHDLVALGHYYLQHLRLMDYWIETYPDLVLTVEYEDTVDALESQARRMLEFIGADFEESVLSYHENKRIVMTPSSEQVRQPIYKSSVNAWRRYGKALQPLMKSLGVRTSNATINS